MVNLPNFHGLTDLHIPKFGQLKKTPADPDVLTLIDCTVRLPVLAFALKPGILATFFKEVPESAVQVPEGLLQGDGIHLPEEGMLLLLFQPCQHCGGLDIVHLLPGSVSVPAHSKPFVVDEAAAPQGAVDQNFLLFVGIGTKFNAFVHKITYGLVFWLSTYRWIVSVLTLPAVLTK